MSGLARSRHLQRALVAAFFFGRKWRVPPGRETIATPRVPDGVKRHAGCLLG